MKRILVLYRELAGYFVGCLNTLCQQYDVEADVVAYPVHSDAPFQFEFSSRIRTYDRNGMDEKQLLELIAQRGYNLIFCGGWSDKTYLKVVRSRGDIPALLGFDNQWNGSIKHQLAALYARWAIARHFDFAFVPGPEQVEFAHKMGFRTVVDGAYSCDVKRFSFIREQRSENFWRGEKKNLFYVGRYAPEKFINELQDAFLAVNQEVGNQWSLTCAGTGPLWEERRQDPSIQHLGFMQPDQLLEVMQTAHAFVLPSTFEPWGVVVHECAAAGLPMVLSDAVGARHTFLEMGRNGYLHKAGDQNALQTALKQIMTATDSDLMSMSQHSYYLALKITPETWSRSLVNHFKP
ncbi:MAG: hypothetical protein RLZZ262_751 [Bacteroidota bacterium]|jgi:glycosyltransferase involved in cell wall biosynthesis